MIGRAPTGSRLAVVHLWRRFRQLHTVYRDRVPPVTVVVDILAAAICAYPGLARALASSGGDGLRRALSRAIHVDAWTDAVPDDFWTSYDDQRSRPPPRAPAGSHQDGPSPGARSAGGEAPGSGSGAEPQSGGAIGPGGDSADHDVERIAQLFAELHHQLAPAFGCRTDRWEAWAPTSKDLLRAVVIEMLRRDEFGVDR